MKEKISVVIPTYNREKTIAKSIESVLNQSYKNIEVIVVDDGSVDNTKKIIKEIKDKRLKYIKLDKNKGACYARNVGIKNANGEYISFQDSDDVFKEDKLEKQLKHLKERKSDLDFCKIRVHSGNNEVVIPNQKEAIDCDDILNILSKGNIISTQAILAKKEIFNSIKFDEELPRWQDYDLVLRIASKYKISYTNLVLVDLYRNNDNISNDDKKLKKAISIMVKKDYHLDEIENYNLLNVFSEYFINDLIKENEEKYRKLYNDYCKLQNEYNKLEKDYIQIINSKRWKMINKIFKK